MMKKALFSVLTVLMASSVSAQTLFTVNGDDVSVAEFKRMYEKNSQDKSEMYKKESLNKYLDLYIAYKLKLNEAKELGMYEDPKIRAEIRRYQEDLVRSTFDKAIMNDLLAEAYERSKEMVCVSHIQINVRRSASKATEEAAYQEAIKVRNLISQGMDFASAAKRHSNDMETKFDGGTIGCFTALQLSLYDLESAAYELQKGQISMPVRTRLGYHILKLDDRKKVSGEVQAAHIFARANEHLADSTNAKARDRIYKAYNELNNGSKWSAVVREFSEDKRTKADNGEIGWFGVGTYDADFENPIFNIRKVGDYTKPVKTSVGYHIFKLLDREALPSFKDMEPDLRQRIMNDERYEAARKNYGESLKNKYGYKRENETITDFIKEVASGISISGWQVPTSFDLSRKMFSLGKTVYTAADLVNYVRQQHAKGRFLSFTRYYNNFESEKMMDYHRKQLLSEDENMQYLMDEYRDGIVLFNLMEKRIWSNEEKIDKDARTYFERHKEDYVLPPTVETKAYSCKDSKTARKVKKMLSKNSGDAAIKALNLKSEGAVSIETVYLERGETNIGSKDLWRLGAIASKTVDGRTTWFKSIKLKPGKSRTYDEVESEVKQEYRKNLESNWIDNLKQKFEVKVNEEVFNSLIR